MQEDVLNRILEKKDVSINIETGISLKISDDVFQPGTVRVHLPTPINTTWLKEGQLIDAEPFFRMMSVEDYPQRSAYFNEILTENREFSVKYAFTSVHRYIVPDFGLTDSAPQKSFNREDIERFMKKDECGCESYTALGENIVTIKDVIPSKGLKFLDSHFAFLESQGIDPEDCANAGSKAKKLFNKVLCHYSPSKEETLSMAYVSMCRICKIPARWQGGYALDENGKVIPHDWCMINLQPYGWINIDPEFAKIYALNPVLREYFFGNIDPCMVPTASEPAANLYPAKDYERADKIFNVYGEVELVPGKFSGEGHYTGRGLEGNEFTSELNIKYDMSF